MTVSSGKILQDVFKDGNELQFQLFAIKLFHKKIFSTYVIDFFIRIPIGLYISKYIPVKFNYCVKVLTTFKVF